MVAASETYESKAACLKGIDAVKRLAADAPIIEEAAPVKKAPAKKAAPATK